MAPARQHRFIAEGKSQIAGDGDVAAERLQRANRRRSFGCAKRPAEGAHAVDVDMALNMIGGGVEECVQILGFPGLNQPEMACRQGQRIVAWQCAHQRDARRRHGGAQYLLMAAAGDMIKDYCSDLDIGAVAGEAFRQRRHRGALAAHIYDEDHRNIEMSGEIGGRATAPGSAVEQPHYALAENKIGVPRQRRSTAVEAFGAHRPGVEIDARTPRRCSMVGSIDIVGPGLERRRGDPGTRPLAQQAERENGLAGARLGSCKKEPPRRAHKCCPII